MHGQRIAVVGGGVAGLGAAWLLSQHHEVTLIEANDYVGGHTNTVEVPGPDGEPMPVDTGFIVYNEPNYPLLSGLFQHLGVVTRASDMSFGFSSGDPDLEYAGDNLATLFGQRRNLVRPAFLGMVRDILRFNRAARTALTEGLDPRLSLEDFLQRQRLGEALRHHYLLPMAAAIWSCPQQQMLEFPAAALLRFFHQHGLIQLTGRPQWRTVCGGGRAYVRRMLPALARAATGTPVRRVSRDGDGVRLLGDDGELGRFDAVVLAAHADQTLDMLEHPTSLERTLLGAFRYQPNEAWLHTDPGAMPRRRRVWSSWNHMSTRAGDGSRPVSVTYWMNRLQSLPGETPYLVSLNPTVPPRPERTLRRVVYQHPVFDGDGLRAQALLPRIQGRDRLWFCGSYFGYGFHEDALRSGAEVARALGAALPWRAAQADGGGEPRGELAPEGA